MTTEVLEEEVHVALMVEVRQDLMDEVLPVKEARDQAAEARQATMMMTLVVGEDPAVLEVVVLVDQEGEAQVVLEVQVAQVAEVLRSTMTMTLEAGVAQAVQAEKVPAALVVQMGLALTVLMVLADVDPLATTLGVVTTTTTPSTMTTIITTMTAVAHRSAVTPTTVTSSAGMAKLQTTSTTTSSGVRTRTTPMIAATTTQADSASATKIKKGGGVTSMADVIYKLREDLRSRITLARVTSTGARMDTIPRKNVLMTGTPPTSRKMPNHTTG